MLFLISWLTALLLIFYALLNFLVNCSVLFCPFAVSCLPFFSALRSICQLILVGPCIFIFFKRSRKDIITKSWSLPMSAPGKLLVLAVFTLVMKRLLINHNIFNLVMVSSIRAVPCPSSGCFVFAKCIRQHIWGGCGCRTLTITSGML